MIVACVWVQANVPYSVDYVVRLRSMVARHLRRPHRFVCFTDRPDALPTDMFHVDIALPPHWPGWWAKLELFSPWHGMTGEALYLDLDVLVVGSLDAVSFYASGPEGLALLPPGGTFQGRFGRKVVRRYNSSVMRLRFGENIKLWQHGLREDVINRLWGDQDWIGEQLPNLPVMPGEWFPRLSQIEDPPNWPSEARVVLCKVPKNHEAVARWPWFGEWWR